MSFYGEFADLKANLLTIREVLGDPRCRVIAVENNPTSPTFLFPNLVVTTPPPRLIGLTVGSNPQIPLIITAEDLYVQDVNRNYPVTLFKNTIWVDAVIGTDGLLTGIRCYCKYLENKSGLSYNMILSKNNEQRRPNV